MNKNAFGLFKSSTVSLDDMKVVIRRLTTSSSAVAPPGHIFSTTWQWYWKDEYGKWQSYDSASDGHLQSNTNSNVLEKKYLSGASLYNVLHIYSEKEKCLILVTNNYNYM